MMFKTVPKMRVMAKNTSGGVYLYTKKKKNGHEYSKTLTLPLKATFPNSSEGLIQSLWPNRKFWIDLNGVSWV